MSYSSTVYAASTRDGSFIELIGAAAAVPAT